jgi:alpha-galactosidase
LIDFATLSLYYECLRFISSTKRAILQSDNNNRFRWFRAATAAVLGIVFTTVFAPCSFAVDADVPGGEPQIQGGNVRIEFDNHLRSRVVSGFDKTETVIGQFTASETVATADQPWAGFLLTSQKHERTKDACGEGERLTVEGKAGELKKTVSVPQ